MKVVIIGANGTIGREVARLAAERYEIVTAGRSHGDHRVDIASRESIERMYDAIGSFDALICAAGNARFRPLDQLSEADFTFSLENKLMGQVNLVRLGMGRIADGGSFTLTSGVLANEPTPGSAAISIVNAGVDAFARAAALELPRGLRINVVSPPWVSETLEKMGRDGSTGLPAADVARAYIESLEGKMSGQVLDARERAGARS